MVFGKQEVFFSLFLSIIFIFAKSNYEGSFTWGFNINPLNIKEGFNPPLPSERIKIGVFIHDIEELKLYYIRGRWFITPFPSLNPRGGWGWGVIPPFPPPPPLCAASNCTIHYDQHILDRQRFPDPVVHQRFKQYVREVCLMFILYFV